PVIDDAEEDAGVVEWRVLRSEQLRRVAEHLTEDLALDEAADLGLGRGGRPCVAPKGCLGCGVDHAVDQRAALQSGQVDEAGHQNSLPTSALASKKSPV